ARSGPPRVRASARAREPVDGRHARRRRPARRARLAPHRRRGSALGDSRAGALRQPGLLRQLSHRAPAAEPDAGSTRRLRRAHLRAGGPAGIRSQPMVNRMATADWRVQIKTLAIGDWRSVIYGLAINGLEPAGDA